MSYFRSPLHPHILSLRNLSPRFQAYHHDCRFCEGEIDGSTSIYCCEKCGFFIHKSCARSAPPLIQHPRHEHPLELPEVHDVFDPYYRCVRECKYRLPASDAMRTLQVEKYYCSKLREPSDGESRLQFDHEHPLTTVPVRRGVSCGGCQMRISEEEEAYGCSECHIFLHEACAKAPLEIEHHPFHPRHPLYLTYDSSEEGECHACRRPLLWEPIRYRCEECKLIFHLSCVISTMPSDDDDGGREDISRRPTVIDHPLHPHQLSSYHFKAQARIECRICGEWILSDDFFGCLDCSFFIHGSCAQPPIDAIQQYFHPEHTLTLAQRPNEKEYECAMCEYKSSSYYYTCQLCSFFIHPSCASATLSYLEKGGGMTVRYSFHEHELKIYREYESFEFCTVCDWPICAGEVDILAYKCFSEGCKFKLHKSCWELPSNLEHSSHSLHPLTLSSIPPHEDTVCGRCYTRISGLLAFSCRQCNFNLDVICAQIPTTLKHPFHEHDLFYFKENPRLGIFRRGEPPHFGCRACLKTCDVDLFRCAQCDFNLHYECSQLPLTINSEHHVDPLVLRESYVEEDHIRHYCDICEQRRDPKKWVYFCETYNCELAAHVECALSPVKLEVIEEDDLITQKEAIQKLEEDIRVVQGQMDEKEESLKSLLVKLESQCAQLKKLKIEHAKWIDIEVIEEDKSIRGEKDVESWELEKIQDKLETEQANWLIDFLKKESNLPASFFQRERYGRTRRSHI